MRVCVLTNILPPYRVEFYRHLARSCELTLVVDAVTAPDRSWQVDTSALGFDLVVAGHRLRHTVRQGQHYESESRYFSLGEKIIPILREARPDVVVSLELGARTLMASLHARRQRIPLVCYWEGTPHTEAAIGFLRRLARPRLARRVDAFWVNGHDSAAYARQLGVPAERIYPGMTGVDTSFFFDAADNARARRAAERARLGLAGLVFGFSGSLSPRKGIAQFLAAFDAFVRRSPAADVSLLFIGDGELRPDVQAWAASHPGVPVAITGFRQLADLPQLYACADWMVMPTLDDCWPLANLEPLVCGVPQVFSRYSGAAADLLDWPGTGLLADPLDTGAFAAVLQQCLALGCVRVPEQTRIAVGSFYGPAQQAQRAHDSLAGLAAPLQLRNPA